MVKELRVRLNILWLIIGILIAVEIAFRKLRQKYNELMDYSVIVNPNELTPEEFEEVKEAVKSTNTLNPIVNLWNTVLGGLFWGKWRINT